MDISIKRTLKIGHRLCRFYAIQQRKKLRQYLCRSFLVGAGGFASRGLKNSPQDCFLPSADGRPVRILPAPAQKRTRNLSCGSFLCECDKRDTLLQYSFLLEFLYFYESILPFKYVLSASMLPASCSNIYFTTISTRSSRSLRIPLNSFNKYP